MPQMEEKNFHNGKIISIYLFVYFTYFPYFAGSGVAVRTSRREQAEGETSLRQNLFLQKFFYLREENFWENQILQFSVVWSAKKQSLYHSRKEFMNRWYYKSERSLTDNCKKRFNHNLSRKLKIKGNFSRHGKSS